MPSSSRTRPCPCTTSSRIGGVPPLWEQVPRHLLVGVWSSLQRSITGWRPGSQGRRRARLLDFDALARHSDREQKPNRLYSPFASRDLRLVDDGLGPGGFTSCFTSSSSGTSGEAPLRTSAPTSATQSRLADLRAEALIRTLLMRRVGMRQSSATPGMRSQSALCRWSGTQLGEAPESFILGRAWHGQRRLGPPSIYVDG